MIPIIKRRGRLSASAPEYSYISEVMSDSPRFYWLMDESSSPCLPSAGAYNYNVTGGTFKAEGHLPGGAVSFNGSTDHAETSGFLDFSSSNKVVVESIMKVISYTGDPVTNQIFEFGPNIAAENDAFSFSRAPANHAGFVKGNVGWNSATWSTMSSGFHHVAIVYDFGETTNELHLYVDGNLQTPASTPDTSNNTANFGNRVLYLASRAGTQFFANIAIQHIALYNDLSAERILDHAQAAGF